MYHGVLGLVLLGAEDHGDPRVHLHETMWPAKALLWLGCMGTALTPAVTPPSLLVAVFRPVALALAVLYVLLQGLFFVAMAHDLAEACVDAYVDTGAAFYRLSLLLTCGLLNGGAIAAACFLYVQHGSVVPLVVVTSISLGLAGLHTAVSVLPVVQRFNPRSGLMQPAFVTAYVFYELLAAALRSPFVRSVEGETPAVGWLRVVGLGLAFVSLAYSAMASGVRGAQVFLVSDKTPLHIEGEGQGEAEGDPSGDYNYSFFHGVFVLAAAYMSLVLTEWAVPVLQPDGAFETHPTALAFWLRISGAWLVSLLYMLTVFAPALFPDRDFGFDV